MMGEAVAPAAPPKPAGGGPKRSRRPGRGLLLVLAAVAVCLALVVLLLPRVTDRGLPGVPPEEPPPLSMPDRVVGGYWMKWHNSHSIRLADVDPRYNVVYLAFAVGQPGTGALHFRQSAQPQAQFREDVATLHGRGTRLILSIGGEDGHVDLSTPQSRQELVDSLIRIHHDEVPFDGIDWDIEAVPIDVDGALEVSHQLKQHFGPQFAITLAPPGGDRQEYKVLAQRLGDDLDYIGVQYYDYPTASQAERLSGVEHRTRELIDTYGIPPHKIVIGMAVVDARSREYHTGDGSGRLWTVESSLEGWNQLHDRFPGLRGVYLWEVSTDARLGGRWIASVAPEVIDTGSPTTEPTP